MVDYVDHWHARADVAAKQILHWLKVPEGTFYKWRGRHGQPNEHNGHVPRDHWLAAWEKEAIVRFHVEHPLNGYRRLAYMMLDADIVAASPASVYRVLKQAGLLQRWNRTPSRKGQGFQQPLAPHQHWHVDVAHVNIAGTFYFLCSVLDGFSRYTVHWEIRPKMEEIDVETIVQRAREKHPGQTPRIITDNGPQFIAKDFKEFIRVSGMTHVRTSPYYPQSNGKLERWHRTIKSDCIRPGTPLSVNDARRIIGRFVDDYNNVRLHSAVGYITPRDVLLGRAPEILAERKRKLEEARLRRRRRQPEPASAACYTPDARSEDKALLASNLSAAPGPEARQGDPASPLPPLVLLRAAGEKRTPETLPSVPFHPQPTC